MTVFQVDLMDHPLHTITYVADIDRVLVIMAHVRPPPLPQPASPAPTSSAPTSPADSADNGVGETPEEGEGGDGEGQYIPKMTCHVLDTANVSGQV